jgi:hypothetical protein
MAVSNPPPRLGVEAEHPVHLPVGRDVKALAIEIEPVGRFAPHPPQIRSGAEGALVARENDGNDLAVGFDLDQDLCDFLGHLDIQRVHRFRPVELDLTDAVALGDDDELVLGFCRLGGRLFCRWLFRCWCFRHFRLPRGVIIGSPDNRHGRRARQAGVVWVKTLLTPHIYPASLASRRSNWAI